MNRLFTGATLFAALFVPLACASSSPPSQDAQGDATSAGGKGGGGGGAGGGTGGSAGTAGAGGSGCDCGAFKESRACCGSQCVNLNNDPHNCGKCGVRCAADQYCGAGVCTKPPCSTSGSCEKGTSCCGGSCCQAGQLCCTVEGPVSAGAPTCFTPTKEQPTCAPGCAPLCISDRNVKRAIKPVDPKDVLAKVSQLPISTWQYTADPPSTRHMGPMAQDFRASFGLGDTDRAYHAIDAHGVALAAIQALDARAREQQKRINALERENRTLARQVASLRGVRNTR